MTQAPVIVTVEFGCTAEALWAALTEVDQMTRWFFDNIPDFRAEVGFCTQFNVNAGERNFLHQWEVTEVIPEKKISYSWQYSDYKGLGMVHFEIVPTEEGSKLHFKMTGLETFDDSIPEFQRESCVGGWNYFLKGNLANYLTEKYSD